MLRRDFFLGSLASLPGPAIAQNSFLTPGGASVPGIVTMCISGNLAAPCTPGGGSFPPNVSGTLATVAANFAGNQYWASGASRASFAAWLTAIGGTYTRASSATYLQGGVVKTATTDTPRFPTDLAGVSQGIRLTGAATNLLLQSQAPASWSGGGVGVSSLTATNNVGIAPDGTSTFGTIVEGTSNARHYISAGSGPNSFAAGPLTFSLFVAPLGGARWLNLVISGTTALIGQINLSTGTVTIPQIGADWSNTSITVTPLAGGIYRVDLTGTSASVGSSYYFELQNAAGAIATPYTGDGVSGASVWGCQLTQTAFPADYIPTTTVAVTQAADSLSFPYTQTTFSALVNVIGQQSPIPTVSSSMVILGISSNATIFVYYGAPTVFSTANGASVLSAPAIIGSISNAHKIMAAGSPSGRSITNDGSTPVSDGGAFAPSPTICYLGQFSGAQSSYGNIQQLALWNGLVASAAEMQRLTT